MRTFDEYVKSHEGRQEAKNKVFTAAYEEVSEHLGRFSHISENEIAVFVNGTKETRIPLFHDGKENPGLRFIQDH